MPSASAELAKHYRLHEPYGFDLDEVHHLAYPFNRHYTYLGSEPGVRRQTPPSVTRRIYLYGDASQPWLNRAHAQGYDVKRTEVELLYTVVDARDDAL
jgi:hypothetical protein